MLAACYWRLRDTLSRSPSFFSSLCDIALDLPAPPASLPSLPFHFPCSAFGHASLNGLATCSRGALSCGAAAPQSRRTCLSRSWILILRLLNVSPCIVVSASSNRMCGPRWCHLHHVSSVCKADDAFRSLGDACSLPCIPFLQLLAFDCRPERLHRFRLSLI